MSARDALNRARNAGSSASAELAAARATGVAAVRLLSRGTEVVERDMRVVFNQGFTQLSTAIADVSRKVDKVVGTLAAQKSVVSPSSP